MVLVKLLSVLVACSRGIKIYSVCPLQKFAGAVMCQKQPPDKYSTSSLWVFLVALNAE